MAAVHEQHGSIYRVLRAITPVRRAARAARGFLDRYRLPTWSLEGAERHSGQPLRIFFAGQLENKNYIARLAFGENHTEIECGGMWLWSAYRQAGNNRAGHDLAVVDSDTSLARRLKGSDAFLIPNWIRGEIDLAVAVQQIKRSESVKTDLRKIRQYGLCFEVTKEEREFERFYHDMYLPYANETYAGMMFLMPHEDLRKFMAQSELLWVKNGAEKVAGLMLRSDGVISRAYVLGVKDGDPQYVKSGALGAAYYFAILHLTERGAQRLHLGGSRPFLRDGVLQYKKKWGIRIVDKSPQFFVLTRTRNTRASLSFLANNPFFFETEDVLSGAIFNGRDLGIPDVAIHRWRKEFEDMGISHVQVFDAGEERELSHGGS
jgi:hypothetical protein